MSSVLRNVSARSLVISTHSFGKWCHVRASTEKTSILTLIKWGSKRRILCPDFRSHVYASAHEKKSLIVPFENGAPQSTNKRRWETNGRLFTYFFRFSYLLVYLPWQQVLGNLSWTRYRSYVCTQRGSFNNWPVVFLAAGWCLHHIHRPWDCGYQGGNSGMQPNTVKHNRGISCCGPKWNLIHTIPGIVLY